MCLVLDLYERVGRPKLQNKLLRTGALAPTFFAAEFEKFFLMDDLPDGWALCALT